MSKFNQTIITTVIILIGMALILGFTSQNPEDIIIGEWDEASWTYEKSDEPSMFYYDLTSVIKHEAERWIFTSDNTIIFEKDGEIMGKGCWTLKGRGHILSLEHEDGAIEKYDVKELNDEEMILNFGIGMETRGIAKLTFKK